MPTQLGLRLFVDGLLEVGELTPDERKDIEAQIKVRQTTTVDNVLTEAGEMISGLSHCAGVVLAEKLVSRLKHIEFVPLEPGQALVVLVGEDNSVENRVIQVPPGLPPSSLTEAANYLNSHIRGLDIADARVRIEQAFNSAKAELDELTRKVVQAGLAEWSGSLGDRKSLIVRGQSNLLKDVKASEDLERIRQPVQEAAISREDRRLLGL